MTEWINVNDKKSPECTVLTWDGYYIRTAEILFENDHETVWLDGGVCFSSVTHWMPLPAPPKIEEIKDFTPYPGG